MSTPYWGGTEGTLPAAAANLYLVAAGYRAVVRMITLQNDTGGAETVTISKRAGGTDYQLFEISLADGYSVEFPGNGGSIMLDAGDSIRGDDGGSAAGIDYTISYAEEAI